MAEDAPSYDEGCMMQWCRIRMMVANHENAYELMSIFCNDFCCLISKEEYRLYIAYLLQEEGVELETVRSLLKSGFILFRSCLLDIYKFLCSIDIIGHIGSINKNLFYVLHRYSDQVNTWLSNRSNVLDFIKSEMGNFDELFYSVYSYWKAIHTTKHLVITHITKNNWQSLENPMDNDTYYIFHILECVASKTFRGDAVNEFTNVETFIEYLKTPSS